MPEHQISKGTCSEEFAYNWSSPWFQQLTMGIKEGLYRLNSSRVQHHRCWDKRDVPHLLYWWGAMVTRCSSRPRRWGAAAVSGTWCHIGTADTTGIPPPPPTGPHSSSSTALVCPVTLANPCHLLHQIPGFLNGVIFIINVSLHLCSENVAVMFYS